MTLPLLTFAALLGGGPQPSPTPARPSPTPTPPPGLSWEQAQSLQRKLSELELHARAMREAQAAPRGKTTRAVKAPPGGTVVVTQGELNSYVGLLVQPRFPKGLNDVDFKIEGGRLVVSADVDLEKAKEALKANSIFNPLSLLSGNMSLEAKGRLKNKEEGFGAFEVEDVRVGPMMVPPSLLQQLVASATRTAQNPQGFDILAPFRFPYALKKVRLQQGRALLDF